MRLLAIDAATGAPNCSLSQDCWVQPTLPNHSLPSSSSSSSPRASSRRRVSVVRAFARWSGPIVRRRRVHEVQRERERDIEIDKERPQKKPKCSETRALQNIIADAVAEQQQQQQQQQGLSIDSTLDSRTRRQVQPQPQQLNFNNFLPAQGRTIRDFFSAAPNRVRPPPMVSVCSSAAKPASLAASAVVPTPTAHTTDEVGVVSESVQTICPLSQSRIRVPVRTTLCTHAQTFCLESLKQLPHVHDRVLGTLLKCPVCGIAMDGGRLYGCAFTRQILAELDADLGADALGSGLVVEIFPDSSWQLQSLAPDVIDLTIDDGRYNQPFILRTVKSEPEDASSRRTATGPAADPEAANGQTAVAELSYRELQVHARRIGVKANQCAAKLRKAIIAHDISQSS